MIGVLNVYHWDGDPNSYQARYAPMFSSFLEATFPETQIRIYNVPSGDRPQTPKDCDRWLISGSSKSVYEDFEWVHWVKSFVQQIHEEKSKLIGLCFGHQMIAHALGGQVKKSDRGWGVGVREFNILTRKTWMNPSLKAVRLLYSHQDQVVSLPPGSEHLGQSAFCEYECYQLGEHILSFQGHPEFSKDFALERYTSRKELIGDEIFEEAKASLKNSTHAQEVWSWIKSF